MNDRITLETPAETRERCKAHGAEWLGDRISFKIRDASYRRGFVRAIFGAHGMSDYLPAEPKPEAVLKRATREGNRPKGYINDPFVSPKRDTPMAIHVTKVRGSGESGDEYTCLARVRIAHRVDPTTGASEPFAVAKPPDGETEFADLTARDRAIWIANQCNVVLHEAQNKDIGIWLRSVLERLGAAKSLGGGNNYWIPASLCDRVHALMSELTDKLGADHFYYERDPKTTLGAPHTRALFAQAAERSLSEDLASLKDELKKAIDKSAGPRKRTASLNHQIERLQLLGAKIELYKEIVARKATDPLQEVMELYRQHFNTLIDGGTVDLGDDEPSAPPPAVESEPARPAAPPSGEALAASAGASADMAWCD